MRVGGLVADGVIVGENTMVTVGVLVDVAVNDGVGVDVEEGTLSRPLQLNETNIMDMKQRLKSILRFFISELYQNLIGEMKSVLNIFLYQFNSLFFRIDKRTKLI